MIILIGNSDFRHYFFLLPGKATIARMITIAEIIIYACVSIS